MLNFIQRRSEYVRRADIGEEKLMEIMLFSPELPSSHLMAMGEHRDLVTIRLERIVFKVFHFKWSAHEIQFPRKSLILRKFHAFTKKS